MLLKFVIILLVTVHGFVTATTVTRDTLLNDISKKMVLDGVIENPEDCAAVYADQRVNGSQPVSGIYVIYPRNGKSFKVYCDMTTDGGGWIVIQRRGDYPKQQNFYRSWKDYKEGFESFQRDFWLGNDKISILTNQNVCNLRFDLEDFDEHKRFAEYVGFVVASESELYEMKFESFLKGDAGDSFTRQNGARFSTIYEDHDQDFTRSCATTYKGAWWYKVCPDTNLNGLYLRGDNPNLSGLGVNWKTFHGGNYSLKTVEMKIRPVSFRSEG